MAKLVGSVAGLLKTTVKLGTPKAKIALRYALAEMTPPKLTELGAIRTGYSNLLSAAKARSYRNLTVREAWLNTLVTIEVICWFFVGEVIGKRHIVGYDV